MTGRSHDLGAFTALVIAFVHLSQPPSMTLLTAAVAFGANFIGGLFPDIDQTTSDFWDNFRFGEVVGKIVCKYLGGHRHISHSAIGFVIIGFGSRFLLNVLAPYILIDMNIVWWCFMIGVLSHFVLDIPTKEGLPLFWPLKFKVGIPPMKSLRIEAGGLVENYVAFPGMLFLSAYLMYTHQSMVLQLFHQYIH